MLTKKLAAANPFRSSKKDKSQKRFEELLFHLAVFDFSLNNLEKSTKELKKLLMSHTGASGCTIMTLDDYGQLWKVGETTTYPFRIGEGVAGWAAKCKKVVYIQNVEEDKRYKELFKGKKGKLLCIPIVRNNKTIGVLNFTYKNGLIKNKVSESVIPDKATTKFFSEKVRGILENVIQYQKANDRQRELEARKEISAILFKTNIPFKQKIEDVTKKTRAFMNVSRVTICLLETKNISSLVRHSPKMRKVKNDITIKEIVSLYKKKDLSKPKIVDLSKAFSFELLSREGSGYVVMQPIFVGNRLVGFILIEDVLKNVNNMTNSEKEFLLLVVKRLSNFLNQLESSKKIIEEKEKWRHIFQNDTDGIIFLTKERVVIEANPKAKEIFGDHKESLTGQNFFSLFSILSPSTKSPTLSSIKNIDRFNATNEKELGKKIDSFFSLGRSMRPKEYFIETNNGHFWVTISMNTSVPIGKKTESPGVLNVRDITKRKELEIEKNEFISLVSHELRTPLSAMKGFLSMVLNKNYGELNERQTNALLRTEESTERMVHLVEDILDVSRIDLGKFNLDREPVDILDAISSPLREVASRIEDKNIKITLQKEDISSRLKKGNKIIPSGLQKKSIYILADKNRLIQIVQNLLNNAINYSFPGGSIDISVREDNETVGIRIKDSGVGISKTDQEKLFKKFHRIQNQLTSQVDGTGLGLYITKKLVETQGGNIGVVSEKDKGACFSVTFPKARQLPLVNLTRKEINETENITS